VSEGLKDLRPLARQRGTPRMRQRRIGLVYFTPRDVLIPRVDRQCILRFCEAMAARGIDVEVVSLNVRLGYDEPSRSRHLFDVYGIKTPFSIKVLANRTRQGGGERINPIWRVGVYALYAARGALTRRGAFQSEQIVVYFKNYLLALPFLVLRTIWRSKLFVVLEIHVPPKMFVHRFLLRRMDGVVAISGRLAGELTQRGVEPDRVLVAHQGVNLDAIEEERLDKAEARRRLELPLDRRLAVYTGKVHDWSGEVDLLLKAAPLLPPDTEVIIVGGREDHAERLRERVRDEGITNVRFIGFVAPADVFRYQLAADVLLSYYPSDNPLNDYRSPGKLFEYMASKRPIVMADYPGPTEVLRPGSALLIEKDDPEKLADGVRRVLRDGVLADRLARQAYEDVQLYTWKERAARVHQFILYLAELRNIRSRNNATKAAPGDQARARSTESLEDRP
jgi:glycosyltransferase involved in cell wall biosynthesis